MRGGAWRRWAAALGLLAGASAAAAAATPPCPQPLRVGFNDRASPPALLGQGPGFAEPPGWEVQAVRDTLARLGCPAQRTQLQRLPARRLSGALMQGHLDIALLYAATPERRQAMRFPTDARGQLDLAWAPAFGHLVLFSRAGQLPPPPGWDGRTLDARWRVGVVTGSVQESVASQRGWRVEPVASRDAEVAMLQAGRFDLLFTALEALPPERRQGLVAWQPPVARLPFFAPASPAFAQAHPAWTRAFWNELCQSVRRLQPEVRPSECGTVPPVTLR